jgi:hypothetical protein
MEKSPLKKEFVELQSMRLEIREISPCDCVRSPEIPRLFHFSYAPESWLLKKEGKVELNQPKLSTQITAALNQQFRVYRRAS